MMELENEKVSDFTESLFQGSDVLEKFSFFPLAEESNDAKDPVVVEFKKRMGILVNLLDEYYNHEFVSLFSEVDWTWRKMVAVMVTHCFNVCDKLDDIFKAFLYVCSFIYIVLKYNQQFTSRPCLLLAQICVMDVFDHKIEEEFHKQGGWDRLESFSKSCNIHEIVDLVTLALDGSTFTNALIKVPGHPVDIPFPCLIITEAISPKLYVAHLEKILMEFFKKEVCRKGGKHLKNQVRHSLQNFENTLEKVLADARERDNEN